MIASGLFLFGCFQIKPASAIPYWLGVGGFLLGLVLVLVQSSAHSVYGRGRRETETDTTELSYGGGGGFD